MWWVFRSQSCRTAAQPMAFLFLNHVFILQRQTFSMMCSPFFFVLSQTTKAFLPRMLELQHGHVVCINSILSQSPIPGAIDYCTSKASSLAFMESLTLGLLDCPGVGCTTVLPFHTNTEMFQGMRVRWEDAAFAGSFWYLLSSKWAEPVGKCDRTASLWLAAEQRGTSQRAFLNTSSTLVVL